MAKVHEGTVVETMLERGLVMKLITSINIVKGTGNVTDEDLELLVTGVEDALATFMDFTTRGEKVPDDLDKITDIIMEFNYKGTYLLSVDHGQIMYIKLENMIDSEKCKNCNDPVCPLSLPNRTGGAICLN
jgi:hypothetical protein